MAQVGAKRLVILGGGLSGLSFLHYLRNFTVALNKSHLLGKVTLLEANDYMGGSIKTNVHADGVIHELGPRSVRTQGVRGKNTIALLEQLGLSDRIVSIKRNSTAGRNRYIYTNNRLYPIPASLGRLFSKFPASNTTLAGAIMRDLAKTPKMDLSKYPDQDPPIYDFISHRFGPEVAESVADPLMRGITAGDARKLSTKALAGQFLENEQIYGSLLKGLFKPPAKQTEHDELFPNEILESKLVSKFQKESIVSYNLSSGLQTLPEHLSNSLLNTNDDGLISIYNQTKVLSLQFKPKFLDKPACSVQVSTIDGDRLEINADHIISSVPAKILAQLMPEPEESQSKALWDYLAKIPHSPVGCVAVEYRNIKDRLPKVVNSFGVLTNSKSGSKVLGISFDSSMFPELDMSHGSTRMTCMIGGSWFKEVLGTDNVDQVTDAQLEQIALEEIRKILRIEVEPHRMTSLLWKTGIAQYLPGHKSKVAEIRENLKNLSIPLTLLGQSFDGVAINDVIFSARMAAYEYVKSL